MHSDLSLRSSCPAWYIYFAADAGSNESHRLWVLENTSVDPLKGTWQMKGKLSGPEDWWAIDPSIFENKGQAYVIWSGWNGPTNGSQKIFIARLQNPWTLGSKPVAISTPELPWEKVGDLVKLNRIDEIPHVDVNERPGDSATRWEDHADLLGERLLD